MLFLEGKLNWSEFRDCRWDNSEHAIQHTTGPCHNECIVWSQGRLGFRRVWGTPVNSHRIPPNRNRSGNSIQNTFMQLVDHKIRLLQHINTNKPPSAFWKSPAIGADDWQSLHYDHQLFVSFKSLLPAVLAAEPRPSRVMGRPKVFGGSPWNATKWKGDTRGNFWWETIVIMEHHDTRTGNAATVTMTGETTMVNTRQKERRHQGVSIYHEWSDKWREVACCCCCRSHHKVGTTRIRFSIPTHCWIQLYYGDRCHHFPLNCWASPLWPSTSDLWWNTIM